MVVSWWLHNSLQLLQHEVSVSYSFTNVYTQRTSVQLLEVHLYRTCFTSLLINFQTTTGLKTMNYCLYMRKCLPCFNSWNIGWVLFNCGLYTSYYEIHFTKLYINNFRANEVWFWISCDDTIRFSKQDRWSCSPLWTNRKQVCYYLFQT